MNLKQPDTWPDFMLCVKTEKKPTLLDQMIWERKLDGVRVQVSASAVRTRNISLFEHEIKLRSGEPIPKGVLLDGELLSDGGFTDVQGRLTRRQWKKLTFVPFDLLVHDKKPVIAQMTRARLDLLHEYDPGPERLQPGEDVPWDWEGIVGKPSCPYFPGQRVQWVKWKLSGLVDVYILGFEEGKGSWAGMPGGVKFGVNLSGLIIEMGVAGGLSYKERWDFHHHPENFIGKKCRVKHFGIVKARFRNPIYEGLVS